MEFVIMLIQKDVLIICDAIKNIHCVLVKVDNAQMLKICLTLGIVFGLVITYIASFKYALEISNKNKNCWMFTTLNNSTCSGFAVRHLPTQDYKKTKIFLGHLIPQFIDPLIQ